MTPGERKARRWVAVSHEAIDKAVILYWRRRPAAPIDWSAR